MSIPHQSLKELAQRSDEEVVHLWLEHRGLSMSSNKPAHTTFSSQKTPEELKTQKPGQSPFVSRPLTHLVASNKEAEQCAVINALIDELLWVKVRLERAEKLLSAIVPDRTGDV